MKTPTKAEADRLVKLYAGYICSHSADYPTQQKMYDAFNRYHLKLIERFPQVDLGSPTFWATLLDKAEEYNRTHLTGPGVTW